MHCSIAGSERLEPPGSRGWRARLGSGATEPGGRWLNGAAGHPGRHADRQPLLRLVRLKRAVNATMRETPRLDAGARGVLICVRTPERRIPMLDRPASNASLSAR